MDVLEFSEEEIQRQLEILGYADISRDKLREFKKDLDHLIRSGDWSSLVSPENSQMDVTNNSPPAVTKEKVSRCSFGKPGDGFFLHPQNASRDVRVLSPQNRNGGPPLGHLDSYSRHSVAAKSSVHVGLPNRLQTETDPEDTLQTDSYTSTPGQSHDRLLLKRKVLRKHRGQSLVCDESIYSEDSVQQDDAEDSTNSSFWSDKETEDEEEEVQPGFATKTESTDKSKEDVKTSDSEEVIERFGDESEGLKSKEESHSQTLDEKPLDKQDENLSKSSENGEVSDGWDDCCSNEGDSQDKEPNGNPASKFQSGESGGESSEIVSDDDDASGDLRKTWKSDTCTGASRKQRRERWKDLSDDSSINAETSSEDEAETRPRRKKESLGDAFEQRDGKRSSTHCGSSSGNPGSESTASNTDSGNDRNDQIGSYVSGETSDGEKGDSSSSRRMKMNGYCQDLKPPIQKKEMVESKCMGFNESLGSGSGFEGGGSGSFVSEVTSTGLCRQEEEVGTRKSKEDSTIGTKSGFGEDGSCRGNNKDHDQQGELCREDNAECVNVSTKDSLGKSCSESSLQSRSKDDTQSSQESKGNHESLGSETNPESDLSDDFDSGSNDEDCNDWKRLNKQDNFYNHSESGDVSKDSSNEDDVRDRQSEARKKSKEGNTSPELKEEEERNVKKCEEFVQDSSGNSGSNIDCEIPGESTETCGEPFGENSMDQKSTNQPDVKASTVAGDEPGFPSPDLSNERREESKAILDFVGNTKDQTEKVTREIGRINAQQSSETNEQASATKHELSGIADSEIMVKNGLKISKLSDEDVDKRRHGFDQEMAIERMDFAKKVVENGPNFEDVLRDCNEKKLDQTSETQQEKVEYDNVAIEMSRDERETSYKRENELDGSQCDDEEIERWFEEGDASEKQTEILSQSQLGKRDLDRAIPESPAVSLLTSGYGTIRSERQDGSHHGDDDRLTVHEFDKDSMYSFGACEQETHGSEARGYRFEQEDEEEERSARDEFWDGGRKVETEERGEGRVEARLALNEGSSEEEDGNRDIKFIDSNVERTYQDWEGNRRPPKEAASRLEERLSDLHLSAAHESENEQTSPSESPSSESLSEGGFESYVRGLSRSHSDGDIRPKPKSFIRPVLGHTGPKKTDPVAKYFEYKQLWDMLKTPGEDDRKALRWEIRERLAYQPPPPKPRKVLAPNTYTVPTEKKRTALRWEIRNDLATGNLPHSYNYRF